MKKRLFALLALLPLLLSRAGAQLTIEEMNAAASGLAQFTLAGMEEEDYLAAVSCDGWIEIVSALPAQPVSYDLMEAYSHADLEALLLGMAAHPGVRLLAIGESAEGRRIYSVSVGSGTETILLVGGLSARETAGTSYIMAQLCSLISQAEAEPEGRLAELLGRFRVVAVPCANPDGRAILDERPYLDWRANAAGVELEQNFPASGAGQLAVNTRQAFHATTPGASDYPGPSLGSEPETRVLLGWLERYIDSARLLVDYAQYGRYIRGGYAHLSASSEVQCGLLAADVRAFLSAEGAEYAVIESDMPLRGWASGGVREYALELAEGLTFSADYGRLGLPGADGALPLCFFGDLDGLENAPEPRNPVFAAVTVEISTKGGLAYYDNARRNQRGEYENCGYGELLPHLLEYALTMQPLE